MLSGGEWERFHGLAYILVREINRDLAGLSTAELWFLRGAGVASAVGTILIFEILIARAKAYSEWHSGDDGLGGKGRKSLTFRQHWLRSTARKVVSSLLLGLPLIVRSGFGVAVSGMFAGIGLFFLWHGVTGRRPDVKTGNDSTSEEP